MVGRRSIRTPRRIRCIRDFGERQKDGVVIDPPSGIVTPRLILIQRQRYPRFGELLPDLIEFRSGDRDGIVGIRVGVEVDAEEVGKMSQREEPRPNTDSGRPDMKKPG